MLLSSCLFNCTLADNEFVLWYFVKVVRPGIFQYTTVKFLIVSHCIYLEYELISYT